MKFESLARHELFQVSQGCKNWFKRQNIISQVKISGESQSADETAPNAFPHN